MNIIENEMKGWLAGVLDEDNSDNEIDRIRTFEEEGILTLDKGLVIYLRNGQKFQLTITESTR